MLATTIDVLKAGLKADPTVSAFDRARLLAQLRSGPTPAKPEVASAVGPRLINRRAAAAMIAKSLRTVDKLAASGVLKRRVLPGRKRAAGFLETDILALLHG